MTDQDRIRVWNEETKKMGDPSTIQEMLCTERNIHTDEGWSTRSPDTRDPDLLYGHLVFMRNTGVYADPSKMLIDPSSEEIFAEDLITHSIEPYVYRVMHKHGCWWAMSLRSDVVPPRLLNNVYNPHIIGNVFENKELVLKGEIDSET